MGNVQPSLRDWSCSEPLPSTACWAKFSRPYGTRFRRGRSHADSFSPYPPSVSLGIEFFRSRKAVRRRVGHRCPDGRIDSCQKTLAYRSNDCPEMSAAKGAAIPDYSFRSATMGCTPAARRGALGLTMPGALPANSSVATVSIIGSQGLTPNN
jgi:hypothetical protein